MIRLTVFAVVASCILAGCASSMSGLSGSDSDFKCKAPVGMQCNSVSGIYANSVAGNYPGGNGVGDGQNSGKGGCSAAGDPATDSVPVHYIGDIPQPGKSDSSTKKVSLPVLPGDKSESLSPGNFYAPTSGTPLRVPPLVLRVWLAPWQDADGDMHDESYIYAVINNGKWAIGMNQRRIEDHYRPLYPLQKKSSANTNVQGDATQAQTSDGGDAHMTTPLEGKQ